jgi:hypothetical protein
LSLPKHLLVVDVSVDPGVEEAWNRWYTNVHLPEIAACPGFRSAARYVSETPEGRNYLSVYDIVGPQAIESPEFAARRGWAEFRDKVKFKTRIYRQIAAQEGSNG